MIFLEILTVLYDGDGVNDTRDTRCFQRPGGGHKEHDKTIAKAGEVRISQDGHRYLPMGYLVS